jgi:hypothetical protein
MDWFIALIVISVSIVSFRSSVPLSVGVCVRLLLLGLFSLLVCVTKGTFPIPIVEHREVGSESLSWRLCGFILSNRDGLCKLIDCVPFVYISGSILFDNVEAFGRDCDRCDSDLFGLIPCFIFMSHRWGGLATIYI